MNGKNTEKKNLKVQAYNTLKNKIVTCEYAPGSMLNEAQLATELGFSRTPIREAISILEMEGFLVETAENGQAALDAFGNHEPGYYNAVLMDIRMPRMDGLEATRTIRAMEDENTDRVPILAMTANAFEEDKARAYEAGMNGYLVKPLDMEAVLDELKKHL